MHEIKKVKLVKIGSSLGVVLPSRDLKYCGHKEGDHLDVFIRKHKPKV